MIIALLLAQTVSTNPPAKEEATTSIAPRSIEFPSPVNEAVLPYLGCISAGWNGVTVTSLEQAINIKTQTKTQCADTRANAKEEAIISLMRNSNLSKKDSALFVDAVLDDIDSFTDGTKDFCV